MRGKKFKIILSLLFALSFFCYADALKIAFGEKRPPFVYEENNKWKGFEIDIVREALKYKGHTLSNEVHFSNKRLERALEFGCDGAASVQEIGDGMFYSDDFISYKNYAISKKKDSIKIEKIEDLTKYSTVAWQNAYINLGEEYTKYFGPESKDLKKYREFVNQSNQNKFFWLGRAQVIIVDKSIFQWYQKELAEKYYTNMEIVYHNIFPEETIYLVKFKSKKIRDDFNIGLKYLKETGKYRELIDAYFKKSE